MVCKSLQTFSFFKQLSCSQNKHAMHLSSDTCTQTACLFFNIWDLMPTTLFLNMALYLTYLAILKSKRSVMNIVLLTASEQFHRKSAHICSTNTDKLYPYSVALYPMRDLVVCRHLYKDVFKKSALIV